MLGSTCSHCPLALLVLMLMPTPLERSSRLLPDPSAAFELPGSECGVHDTFAHLSTQAQHPSVVFRSRIRFILAILRSQESLDRYANHSIPAWISD
ncbi:hypothetical protein BKA66DRAFT_154757 [Pyrenochaeta sp. MPI-SDFR-AT-0127]|nr:hypothetical protein BKA66DRAFT_154757 [Pyrenochaeta sp. MPI-SDFR-AT-0127]